MTNISFLLHGTTLALAWLLLFNVVATLLVALLATALTKRSVAASPGVWFHQKGRF